MAFLCTHLLLKAYAVEPIRAICFSDVEAFVEAYERYVAWEFLAGLRKRVGILTAGMLLARVDGKSPVHYLNTEQRDKVRRFALALIRRFDVDIFQVTEEWRSDITR